MKTWWIIVSTAIAAAWKRTLGRLRLYWDWNGRQWSNESWGGCFELWLGPLTIMVWPA